MLSLDGIQAILFDLDGTLRHNRPSFNDVVFDFVAQLGVAGSGERRRGALRWAHYYWADSPELEKDGAHLEDEARFFANYLRRFLIAFDCTPASAQELAPQLQRHLAETYQPQDWVDPETPGVLARLQEAGLTLGVVSNRHEPYQNLLKALGLAGYFEFTLAAGEVDSWKPDGVIFQQAIQRAGSCPAHTVYVGDNYYADVVGAQRAGLRPVLLDPEGVFPDAGCAVIRSLGELIDPKGLRDL